MLTSIIRALHLGQAGRSNATGGLADEAPGFQRRSFNGSHASRSLASPAFGGNSFLRNGRAERHSAVQRSPRSHSSASLRSRSAMAFSSVARASLRYRIARALLMASQIPTQQNEDSSSGKRLVPGRPPARCAMEGIAPHLIARNSRTHQRAS